MEVAVKTCRTVAITVLVLFGAILSGFWPMDVLAASPDEETPTVQRIVYVLIGVAAVICIAVIFNNDLLTRILGRVGHSSGDRRGPKAGEGAVIHHSSGEADFDGTPGDVSPTTKDTNRDLPYPEKKSAD
jgi:uncharacterized membrane protein YuzA (DUF378 family)